jgi:hypothetical protein
MNRKKSLIVITLVTLLAIAATPLMAQQYPPQTPPADRTLEPSQTQPSPSPQTAPAPAPSPSYSPQSPGDMTTDYDPTRADTGTSWGIPILTLLAGLVVGYLIGHNRPVAPVSDIRRDRTDRVA